MHEVKVAILYTLLVNRSASVIDCRKGQVNGLISEAHLKLNEELPVPTRIRDETLDFRVLRLKDPFDRDHALSIQYKDFEFYQIIYIREDKGGRFFLDGIPRDHSLVPMTRLMTIAFKADILQIIREKHLLRNKKKIKNLTNTTVMLSEKVDQPGHHAAVYTELVSIKPDEVFKLRYHEDRNRMANTWYRIDLKGVTEEISKEWTGIEFLIGKEYISIFDAGFYTGQHPATTPKAIDIQSWPRTYKRIMNKASSKYSQLFKNSR
ncbi:hypothetical protein KC19_6G062700 [Ceratodon purpureus]|uniref:Uncharacterized protein n=1 Tax=Ceratodon purpureus TaxID=3225 RepID=A0A8T0HCR6_CERPU|nr:hypothetical protein KC19_6G062700 [Ceratodon purpureus]